MIIAAAIVAVALSLQPLQTPKEKGVSKGSSTQDAATAKYTDKTQEPAQPTNATIASQISSQANSTNAGSETENVNVQRWIVIFTGVLAVVGVLQLVVMFVTWLVYRRQAREMRRQRHEMRQQRHLMWRQWKAMGIQAAHVEGQLDEMQKSREIENKTLILQYRPKIIVRNAKAMQFSFELGKPWECEISFQIVNTGGSPAHITAGSNIQLASSIGHDVGNIELKWGAECRVSNVTLGPGQQLTVQECVSTGVLFDLEWETFRRGIAVQPLRFVSLMGVIYYTDDLGIPRSTGISRTFEPKSADFIPRKETEQEYSD